MILLKILGRATRYPSRNQMATTANLGLSTEIPGREHAFPLNDETSPTLTTLAFFVSLPVPARGCRERCLSPDVSGLSRVLSPSGHHERQSRRLRAKSHLSLPPNRGRVNGWLVSLARTKKSFLGSDSEQDANNGPRRENRFDRRATCHVASRNAKRRREPTMPP